MLNFLFLRHLRVAFPEIPFLLPPRCPQHPVLPGRCPQHPVLPQRGPRNPVLTSRGPQNPVLTSRGPQNPVLTSRGPQNPVLTSRGPRNRVPVYLKHTNPLIVVTFPTFLSTLQICTVRRGLEI